MRRVRAGMIAGFGLLGGPALADDVGWRPVGPGAVAPAAVAPTGPVTAFLPTAPPEPLRTVSAGESFGAERLREGSDTRPIWQTARLRPAVAVDSPATDTPVFRPVSQTVVPTQMPQVAPPQPMPVLPVPPLPVEPLPVPRRDVSPEVPSPKPTWPPVRTTPPDASPNPLAAQVWGTAPCPPGDGTGDGVAPAGMSVPVRKVGGGSPNLTLTRDHHFYDLFGLSLFADESGTQIVGEAPATDRYFVSAEYLLWWVNPGNIPVLASTSTNGGFGFLGQPGTQTLLGPGRFGPSLRDGFRVRAGAWLDDCATCGVDASLFVLGKRGETFSVNSDTTPTITRPIFAPNFNTEFGELVAFPGFSTGTLLVETDSQLWGADVNFRKAVCRTCDSRSEWFAGLRYLNLAENLRITEFITAQPAAPDPAGTQVIVQDAFSTRNQFYGGQIGWAVGRSRGRWDFDTRFSLAAGVTRQTLEISAFQSRVKPGQPQETFLGGGLLAAGPNIGTFTKDRFSVVPEATFTAGYRVTPNFRATVGYNFLYWSNVIRPGDQIDRVVDLTFVPNSLNVPFSGVNRPQPTFKTTDLFVTGIQFGVEYRW